MNNFNFNSTEELNETAEKLRQANNKDGLDKLAKAYGIDIEDMRDFINGDLERLATPIVLAIASIEKAKGELGTKGVIEDWMGVLASMAAGSEELAEKITFGGKDITELLGKILKQAFDTKEKVNDKITKAAGLRTPLYLGIPGNADLKKIIKKYYGVES